MDEEKAIEKQEEKAATEKLGATAGRAVADYYTGGKYEQIRNAPVIGGIAKGAENVVGKIAAKAPGSKMLGKQAKQLDDAGAIDGANTALGAFGGAKGGNINAKDAQNIRNSMGKNSNALKYGARPSDDDDIVPTSPKNTLDKKDGLDGKEGLGDKGGLGNKEGLQSKEGLESKEETKEKSKSSKSKSSSLFGEKDKKGLAGIKQKWAKMLLKAKIILIILGIMVAGLLMFAMFSALLFAFDNFFTSISTFFGIAEGTNDASDSGLYIDDRYLYDENGDSLSSEDLVTKLQADNNCSNINNWNNFKDWVSGLFGSKFSNPCHFIRYIKRQTSMEYNSKLNTEIDKGLIVGTIFYGFDSQNIDDISEENGTTSAADHYATLLKILSDDNNIITTDTIDLIIENAVITKKYKYYTWTVTDTEEEVESEDSEGSEGEASEPKTIKKKTASCVLSELPEYRYSLDKWKIFMRFGTEAAKKYEEMGVDAYIYQNTSEECRGEKTLEELREQIDDPTFDEIIIDPSVSAAIAEVEPKKDAPSTLSGFDQKADEDSKTKDSFYPVDGLTLDYTNGFAYQNFPAYKSNYNDIFTAKEIETMIMEIIDRKRHLNNVLLLNDMDAPTGGPSSFVSPIGVIGAYCGDYLTASFDSITVNVTDCDGNFMESVPFEEYIIGVANLEVSNTHDDYVLSEMLAAITYSMSRRGNYTKGTIIQMKSGNCDQAYCNMRKGCHAQTANLNCGSSVGNCTSYITGGSTGYNPGLYSKYQGLYQQASQYLVINSNTNRVFDMHYLSTDQNIWESKAKSGMAFTQIIQEHYQDEGGQVVKCSEQESDKDTSSVGNGPASNQEYNKIASSLGDYQGFSYKNLSGRDIEINPVWTDAHLTKYTLRCGGSSLDGKEFTINKDAYNNYDKALKGLCNIATNGVTLSDGTTCKYNDNDFSRGEAFVPRRISSINDKVSLHAYGLRQDWNYDKEYTVNGKVYKPYSFDAKESNYRDFVNALGKEESCENVNYILYKYAYEPAGFVWGGNRLRNEYAGMSYEIKY